MNDSFAIMEEERQERKLPLASKTILEEGLQELIHGSIWTIGPYHKKGDRVVMNTMTGKSEFASWMNTSGTLPHPMKRDEMVLWMGSAHNSCWYERKLQFSQVEVVCLDGFIPRIGGVARIRTLRLKMNILFSHRHTKFLRPEDWLLNLRNTEHLSFRLEVFEFEVSCKVSNERHRAMFDLRAELCKGG